MKKQQWLRIIPFFLCIFTLMAFFLNFGYAKYDIVEGLRDQSKAYTGWQAILTTLYGWVLVALPIIILLAKLLPEARKVEPVASLLLPGLHIVLMFLLLNSLPNSLRDVEGLENPRASVGIGFILMLVCQLGLVVFRLMELTSRPAVPERREDGQAMVPVEDERRPERRR